MQQLDCSKAATWDLSSYFEPGAIPDCCGTELWSVQDSSGNIYVQGYVDAECKFVTELASAFWSEGTNTLHNPGGGTPICVCLMIGCDDVWPTFNDTCPVTVACCPAPVPRTLYAHFLQPTFSNCLCLTPTAITIVYNGAGRWVGDGTLGGCGSPAHVEFYCDALDFTTCGKSFTGLTAGISFACSNPAGPFIRVFDNVSMSTGTCSCNWVRVTIMDTP
jgi:hypothetical protein